MKPVSPASLLIVIERARCVYHGVLFLFEMKNAGNLHLKQKTGGRGKQYGRASLLSVSSILIALSGLK